MKCQRCGTNEDRINGYCSVYCDDIAELEAEVKRLREENERLKANMSKSAIDLEAEVMRLGAELDECRPYRAAVRAMHNGYNAEMRSCYGIKKPESPLEAIRELIEEADSTTVTLSGFTFYQDVSVDDLIQINDEIMRIDSIDSTTQLTVGRGALDTVPDYHPVNSSVFFIGNYGFAGNEFVSGDSIDVKLLDNTNSDQLDSAEAPVDTVVMADRITKPYPVGQLQLDGAYSGVWDISTGNTISATWVDRDRTQQNTTTPPSHTDAGVGPETDVNYTISAVAYDYEGDEINISGDLFSVDKNQTTSHTITPSDNTAASEGTDPWSAVGVRVLTTREETTSEQYDNWQTPEVFAYTQAEPEDLPTYFTASWFDVNSLSSVFQDFEKTTAVASDGDDIGHMENQTGQFP